MLNSIINIVFCAVDSAFGNNISIDAVVVMTSFAAIEMLGTQFLSIGGDAYKVLNGNAKNCCLLSLLSGALLGIILIIFAQGITYIFELTDIQRKMLANVLICYGLCCPMEAVARFMQRYMTFKCYNKLVLSSNIITYVLLIGTDWLAVSVGWGCVGLVLSTEFTWFVYLIILVVVTKFMSVKDKIQLSTLKKAFLYGKDIALGGLISRGANVCFAHFASTMGTTQYAVHAVALGAVELGTYFRDAYCDYAYVRLCNRITYKERKAKLLLSQCWFPALALPLSATFIIILVTHGKVDLGSSLICGAFYCMHILIFPVYDIVQQVVISRGKTKYCVVSCLHCAFWRVVALYVISLFIPVNTIVLSLIFCFDYGSRTLFYTFRLYYDKQRRQVE